MENLKLTKFMKNPNGMYIQITSDEIDEFFSKGYAKLTKEKCKNAYNMFDFKKGILEANHLVKTDENRHTVDLLMFALGIIEDLQQTVKDLENILNDIETEKEEQKNGEKLCENGRKEKTR